MISIPRSIALPALADVTDLGVRLATIRAGIAGRVVFTTSFGLEDQVLAQAIFTGGHNIEVVTLDTGRLFAETYDVWAATEERYQRRIVAYAPDTDALEHLVAAHGINGFRHSIEARKACCGVRKVAPLRRALAGAAAWVTGLRAEQSQAVPLARAVGQSAEFVIPRLCRPDRGRNGRHGRPGSRVALGRGEPRR